MRQCPECDRWIDWSRQQCKCGCLFRVETVTRYETVVELKEKCPSCSRLFDGTHCRCGFAPPPAPLTADDVYRRSEEEIRSFQTVGRDALARARRFLGTAPTKQEGVGK